MRKTVLLTGASKGIGFALAKLFEQNGFNVIGTSRNVKSNYGAIKMLQLDLADKLSIEHFSNTFKARSIAIDILVNNAAIGPDLDSSLPDELSFRETFETNVLGTVMLTEQLLDQISINGKIINVSSKMGSIAVCKGYDSVAYRMSKTALNMYSKILANRLVNQQSIATVHPGWVRTELTDGNKQAPLSAEESALKLFEFINSDFKTGTYWNAPEGNTIEW